MVSFVPVAGAVLEGRYVLRSPLGHGGMGTVWKAEHNTLGTTVAIKLVAPHAAASKEMLQRFRREAQVAASLESPNIVRILDFGIEQDTPFIAMELLNGETLGACLARSGGLAPADIVRIASQVARGISKAHREHIVHCDLKPENIFLAQIDGEEVVKVLDFGIAKAPLLDPLTKTGTVLGTFQYMSPEQLEGRRGIDARSDLYSLAVILFECVCGKPTFAASSIAELVRRICGAPLPIPSEIASVPRGFDAWFKRAASRDPAARFSSAKEMIGELAGILGTSSRPIATTDSNPQLQPTMGVSRTHGSERAGYRITPNVRSRLFEIELWGMWDIALAQRFKTDSRDTFEQMSGSPWVALAFGDKHPPQKPEVQQIEGEMMGQAAKYGMLRTAFVIGSALPAMMAKRLADENKMPNTRFFATELEARAWLWDSDLFARTGGSERSGFRIHPNPYSKTLNLEFWGLWDVPTGEAFRKEVVRAYVEMGERPWAILSNARRYIPQKPEIQHVHEETMGLGPKHGLARVAVLVDSALSQMQIRRLFEEAGSPPHLRFFTDEAEARVWLAEIRGS